MSLNFVRVHVKQMYSIRIGDIQLVSINEHLAQLLAIKQLGYIYILLNTIFVTHSKCFGGKRLYKLLQHLRLVFAGDRV